MIKYFLMGIFCCGSLQAQDAKGLLQLEKNINQSLEEKAQLDVEKNELEKQISEIQLKIKVRKLLIIKRLKALNRIKKFQWGELFLNTNLNDLNRNFKILSNLNAYDLELFKDYNQDFRFLAAARRNLAGTDVQIQNNIKIYRKQQIDFLKVEEIRISFLEKEKSNSFLLQKGKLTRPLEGTLKHEFGNIKDTFGHYYLINQGEFYRPAKNALVKAVGLGVVIFRDVLTRWRETLIVQHSDNYYTVYAGVIGATKKVGDHVNATEVLGSATKNEFYFELRHYANAINPQKWYEELK